MKKDSLDKLNNDELWEIFSLAIKTLKERGEIRTRNVTGESGEQLAIKTFNETNGLPKLQAAPESTRNIDTISIDGDRYSIKTIITPNKVTGVFWGLGTKDSVNQKQKFEYVLIVVIDDSYQLKAIYQLDWITFLKHMKWHSRMKAYNLNLSKKLIEDSKVIYST